MTALLFIMNISEYKPNRKNKQKNHERNVAAPPVSFKNHEVYRKRDFDMIRLRDARK